MFYIIYYRCNARIKDLKEFENLKDLSDWFIQQQQLEPTMIIGIYDGKTKYEETEKVTNAIMKAIYKY